MCGERQQPDSGQHVTSAHSERCALRPTHTTPRPSLPDSLPDSLTQRVCNFRRRRMCRGVAPVGEKRQGRRAGVALRRPTCVQTADTTDLHTSSDLPDLPALHICAALAASGATQADAPCLRCTPPARPRPLPMPPAEPDLASELRHEIQRRRSGKELTARRVSQSAQWTAPFARTSCWFAGGSAGGWPSSLPRRASTYWRHSLSASP